MRWWIVHSILAAHSLLAGQNPVDAPLTHPQLARDHLPGYPRGSHRPDLLSLPPRCRRPALELALSLGLGDAFALPLKQDLALELSHRTQHVQHQPPVGRGSVQSHAQDAQSGLALGKWRALLKERGASARGGGQGLRSRGAPDHTGAAVVAWRAV